MRTPFAALVALMVVAGCANQGAVVTGAGPDDLLKLRTGPGLNHPIVLGLPDGTRLNSHGCVPELGQMWCRVSLADRPGVSGYVSADYLTSR